MDSAEDNIIFVDTIAKLKSFLDIIQGLPQDAPSLSLDLEGHNLGRKGTIDILSIYVQPQGKTYLIDIHELQNTAFYTENDQKVTLKSIIEDESIPKAVFDLRNDSDALFGLYHVSLRGAIDIQLMEYFAHDRNPGRNNVVLGLSTCIGNDAELSREEAQLSKDINNAGARLWKPKLYGSMTVFAQRPLRKEIVQYCANDVKYLPRLFDVYRDLIEADRRYLLRRATRDRLLWSQGPLHQDRSQCTPLREFGTAMLEARDASVMQRKAQGYYLDHKDDEFKLEDRDVQEDSSPGVLAFMSRSYET